jgi:hypothetical protein
MAPDSGIYRSTNGENFFQILSIPITGGSCCSISGNNQVILICAISEISCLYYVSKDYGITWKPTLSYLNSDGFYGSSISYDGKYMLILDKGGVVVSVDYGDTWSLRCLGSYKQVAMSRDGSHMYVCSSENLLRYSLDYGMTWITGSPDPNYGSPAVDCDETGRYVYLTGDGSNNRFWFSNDYGQSFTMILINQMTGITLDVNVNNDGSRIMIFDGNALWFKTITNIKRSTGSLTVNGIIRYDSSTGCNIFASSGTFDYINGGVGRFSTMMADNFKFPPNEIFENILFTDSLTGTTAFFATNTSTNLSGSFFYNSQLTGSSAFFDSITGTNISSSLITCNSGLFTSITGINISSSSFTGSLSSFIEITGTDLFVSNGSIFSYTGQNSWIENSTIYSLTGHKCYLEDVTSHEMTCYHCSLEILTCNIITGTSGYFDKVNTKILVSSCGWFDDIIGKKAFISNITGESAFFESITGSFFSVSRQLTTPSIIGESASFTAMTSKNIYVSSLSICSTTGASAFFAEITGNKLDCGSITGTDAYFSGVITGHNLYSSGNYLNFIENRGMMSSIGNIKSQLYDSTSMSFVKTIDLGEKINHSGGQNRLKISSDKKHLYTSSNRDLTNGKTSHDGGFTWTLDENTFKSAIGTSRDGKYVLTYNSVTSTILVSNNYGHSYSTSFYYTGNTKRGNCLCGCCISDTGQHMGCLFYAGGLQISHDYGKTWSSVLGSPPTTYCYQTCCIACSYDAKYWLTYVGAGIYVSNNYGASFTIPHSTTGNARTASSVCMSREGKYMYVLCSYDNSNPTFHGAWKSSNYGITWNQMKDNSISYVSMTCDMSGKYIIVAQAPDKQGTIEISNDYGNSFTTTITLPHPSIDIVLSDDGSSLYSLVNEPTTLCVFIDIYTSNKITGEFSDGMLQVQGNSYFSDVYCDSLSGNSFHVSFDSSSYISNQEHLQVGTGHLTSILSSNIVTGNLIVGVPDLSESLTVLDITGYTSEWTSTNVVPPLFIPPSRVVVEEEEKITEEEESHTRVLCSDDFTIRLSRTYCSSPSENIGYISIDNGASWISIKENDSGNFLPMNCCSSISRDGTYGLSYRRAPVAEWGGIFVSSDNCRTWHRKLALDCTEIISNGISGNNKCMLCLDPKGKYWISYDYGNTWKDSSILESPSHPSGKWCGNIIDCCLSCTGQFIITSQQGGVWISRSFGKSWSFHILGEEDTGYFLTSISGDGKYMYSCCSNGIYCSGNYGHSWKKILMEEGICSVCCDISGRYITTNTKIKLYISDNYGNSFDYSATFGTFLEGDDAVTVGTCLEDAFINGDGTKCIIVDTEEINPKHWLKTNLLHKTTPSYGGIYCAGTGAFLYVSANSLLTNSIGSTGAMNIQGADITIKSSGKIDIGGSLRVEKELVCVGSITSPCYSFSRVSSIQSLSFKAAKIWKVSSLPNSGYSIAWSPEIETFVVVNHSSVIQISSDGLTWTTFSCPQGNWCSVCWSSEDSLFIACNSGGGANFMSSPNGKNWTTFTEQVNARTGYFLSGSRILTQSDRPSSGISPTSVCYGASLDKKYVAVTGSHTYFYSEDGISWTSNISENLAGTFICFAPELGIFCTVQGNHSSIFDGIDWILSPVLDLSLNSVCWASDLRIFVAVGSNTICTSSNGLKWEEQESPDGSYLSNVCYSPELHLIVAVTGSTINNKIVYSYNGKNWKVTDPPESNTFSGICWSRELGIFIVTSIDGEHKAMISKYVKKCI